MRSVGGVWGCFRTQKGGLEGVGTHRWGSGEALGPRDVGRGGVRTQRCGADEC